MFYVRGQGGWLGGLGRRDVWVEPGEGPGGGKPGFLAGAFCSVKQRERLAEEIAWINLL